MAHFWGVLRGEHGKKVTNLGSPASGLKASLNGFSFGVNVDIYNDGEEDKIEIFLTLGSNDGLKIIKPVSLGIFTRSFLYRNRDRVNNPK